MTKTFLPVPSNLKVYDTPDAECTVCAEHNSKLILDCGHALCIYCYQTIYMQNNQPVCLVCKRQWSQFYCSPQTISLVDTENCKGKIAGILKSSIL